MFSDLFTTTYAPCGVPVYEAEISDWGAAGHPHPVTGESMVLDGKFIAGTRLDLILEDDPANRYGMPYLMVALPDGTALRLLND